MCVFIDATKQSSPVYIDPNDQGDQGEGIYCIKFTQFEKDDYEYEGVEIEIVADGRDVRADYYRFDYEESGNTGVLVKPKNVATFTREEDVQAWEARSSVDDVSKKGHLTSRAAYSKKTGEAEKSRSIPVIFPDGFQLSQKPFISTTEAGTNTASYKAVTYRVDTAFDDTKNTGKKIYMMHTRIVWRFARLETATLLKEHQKGGEKAINDSIAGV